MSAAFIIFKSQFSFEMLRNHYVFSVFIEHLQLEIQAMSDYGCRLRIDDVMQL